MKRKWFGLILCICMIIMFPAKNIYATEQGKDKILKVGFYEQDGYYQKGDTYSGFGVEYLQSIAKYTKEVLSK